MPCARHVASFQSNCLLQPAASHSEACQKVCCKKLFTHSSAHVHVCILSIRAQRGAVSGHGNSQVPQFSLISDKPGKLCSGAEKFMPGLGMQVVTVLCHSTLCI